MNKYMYELKKQLTNKLFVESLFFTIQQKQMRQQTAKLFVPTLNNLNYKGILLTFTISTRQKILITHPVYCEHYDNNAITFQITLVYQEILRNKKKQISCKNKFQRIILFYNNKLECYNDTSQKILSFRKTINNEISTNCKNFYILLYKIINKLLHNIPATKIEIMNTNNFSTLSNRLIFENHPNF